MEKPDLRFDFLYSIEPTYFHWLLKKQRYRIPILIELLLPDGHLVLKDVKELLLEQMKLFGLDTADGSEHIVVEVVVVELLGNEDSSQDESNLKNSKYQIQFSQKHSTVALAGRTASFT